MTVITKAIFAGAAIVLAFASAPAFAAMSANTSGLNGTSINGSLNGAQVNGFNNGWTNSWTNGWQNGQSMQANGQALRVIGIELPR